MKSNETLNSQRPRRWLHGVVVWLLRVTGEDRLLREAAEVEIPPVDAYKVLIQNSAYEIRDRVRAFLDIEQQ